MNKKMFLNVPQLETHRKWGGRNYKKVEPTALSHIEDNYIKANYDQVRCPVDIFTVESAYYDAIICGI